MSRDGDASTGLFRQADGLFRAGRYQDAMQILTELNRQHPDTKNILFPLALCLEQLQQLDEARQICNRLIERFQDPRAIEMRDRISAAQMTALLEPVVLELPPRTEAQRPPVDAAPEPGKRRTLYVIGAIVVLILALPILASLFRSDTPPAAAHHVASPSAPSAVDGDSAPGPTAVNTPNRGQNRMSLLMALPAYLLRVFISFVMSIIAVYPLLMVMGRLPKDDSNDNLIDVVKTMGVVYLWSLLPLIGLILGALHFMRHYELNCLETIIVGVVAGILQTVLLMLLFGAIVGSTMVTGV